jgi:excisionase family DNA binding protein
MNQPNPTAPQPVYITAKDICALLGVSRATLSRWRSEGDFIKPMSIGNTRRWLLSDVHKFMASQQMDVA